MYEQEMPTNISECLCTLYGFSICCLHFYTY